MKKYDLFQEAQILAQKLGVEQVLSALTIKSMEHYIIETNKILRHLYQYRDNPLDMKVQLDMALENNNKILRKYGLKEVKSEHKIDLNI